MSLKNEDKMKVGNAEHSSVATKRFLQFQGYNQYFIYEGEHFRGSALRGDPGRGRPPPPPGAGKFSKIWKCFLKQIAKNALFFLFYSRFYKPCVNFSRVWTKALIVGNF